MTPSRRSFLTGLGATLAVAASPKATLLRSSSLTPPSEIEIIDLLEQRIRMAREIMVQAVANNIFGDAGGMGLERLVRDDQYPYREVATLLVSETPK